jgi:hypothetical protein
VHQDAGNYPTTNFDAFNPASEETNEHVDVQEDHYKVVREIGAASTVLLKNQNGALPLTKPRSIVLVGSDAGPGTVGPNGFADQVRLRFFARLNEFKRILIPCSGRRRRNPRDGLGVWVRLPSFFVFVYLLYVPRTANFTYLVSVRYSLPSILSYAIVNSDCVFTAAGGDPKKGKR